MWGGGQGSLYGSLFESSITDQIMLIFSHPAPGQLDKTTIRVSPLGLPSKDVIPFLSTKSQVDIPFFFQYLFPRSFCDELLHEIWEKNCVHFPYSEKTLSALFFEVA
jgi:hypothetical protein